MHQILNFKVIMLYEITFEYILYVFDKLGIKIAKSS